MIDRVTELAQQGRSLPSEERLRLLDPLLESLQEVPSIAIEAAWATEIERRVRAHEAGEGDLFDAESVLAEAARIAP